MTIAAGTIVTNMSGNVYLVETASKRGFPDAATLGALTLGVGATGAPTLTDATLDAIPDGPAFASVAAYVAANPRVTAMVQRIVRALIPKTGIKDLSGGMMTLAEASAALFADAIANPGNWAAPVQGGSRTTPLPAGFGQAATQAITNVLNKLLNQLINQALSAAQESDVGDSIDEVAQQVDDSGDGDPIPAKDDGDKEDVKEDGDKEAGDKDGTKDDSDKEPGEKELGEKEPGDKEPGDKEPGDKEPGDKEPGEKEPGEKEPGEKDEKDGKEDDDGGGDGGDGGEDDDLAERGGKRAPPSGPKQKLRAAVAGGEWDKFSA